LKGATSNTVLFVIVWNLYFITTNKKTAFLTDVEKDLKVNLKEASL
jgi:hypothetical protein